MKNWKRNTFLLTAVLLAMSGSGYYALSDSGEPTLAQQAAGVRVDMPLDAYRLTPQQQLEVDRAADLLVRACMAKAGFEWYIPAEPPRRVDPRRRRYGVIDPQVAQEWGYHLPVDPASTDTASRRSAVLKDPRADRAYYGPEDDKAKGCAAKAHAELAHGAGNARDIAFPRATTLSWQSLEASKKQRDVVAALRAWKKCMAARGHPYDTPAEAVSDKAWDLDAAAVGRQEKAVAVADVTCKYEVGLVTTWWEAESAVQRGMISANAAALTAQKSMFETYMENVRAVLDRARSSPADG
ncbi:hypothetical protein ABZ896_49515 [Streptomyces sp. NPDC047072]|uniref:hypothetical protein n=1 Tax=Streptomyces sp. NPDC047072 TaxID=3154809 RepID=UPI0033CD89C3